MNVIKLLLHDEKRQLIRLPKNVFFSRLDPHFKFPFTVHLLHGLLVAFTQLFQWVVCRFDSIIEPLLCSPIHSLTDSFLTN